MIVRMVSKRGNRTTETGRGLSKFGPFPLSQSTNARGGQRWSTPEPWIQGRDGSFLASFRDFRSYLSAVNDGQGGHGPRGAVVRSPAQNAIGVRPENGDVALRNGMRVQVWARNNGWGR
jgi:hypothetical protein